MIRCTRHTFSHPGGKFFWLVRKSSILDGCWIKNFVAVKIVSGQVRRFKEKQWSFLTFQTRGTNVGKKIDSPGSGPVYLVESRSKSWVPDISDFSPGPSPGSRIFRISVPVPVPGPRPFRFQSRSRIPQNLNLSPDPLPRPRFSGTGPRDPCSRPWTSIMTFYKFFIRIYL